MAMSPSNGRPSGGALTDVLELILDRGVVIDIFVRVSVVGIELLTIEARIVVASVDTYLRYAEAVSRLNLDSGRKFGVQDLIGGGTTENAIEASTSPLAEENRRLRERVDHLERELAPPGVRADGHGGEGP